MKRKKLQFSLVLTSIVLGGLFLGFSTKGIDSNNSPGSLENGSVVNGNRPDVEYFSNIRNNQHSGVIALEDLQRLNEQMKQFSGSRSASDISWTQLGPDNFGGRTRAILFDNTDSNNKTVYAAGVTGGIWKTTDVGITWAKINKSASNLYVTCMAQDANGKIYVGTGENFAVQTFSGLQEMGFSSGFMGQGIYESTDGENFSLIASTQPEFNDQNSDWAFINRLAVEDNLGNVFAATNNGLKYSADGGNTWSFAKDESGNDLNSNAWDVKVSSDGAVVACVNNLCYLSLSGNAEDFVLKSTGDSLSLPASEVGRIEFAYAPSDANILYASVVTSGGNLQSIYRSEDAGLTWRVILPASTSMSIFSGQGVYDNAITVFPDKPGKIIVGGIDAWEGELIQEEGFFAWKSISTSLVEPYYSNYLPMYHHAYVFQPGTNNSFLVGTDGGLAIGAVVEGEYEFRTSNRSYFTTQFYAVGVSGVMNYVTGGSQSNGSILITGEGNTVRQGTQLESGSGCATVVSLIDKDVLVVSMPGGDEDFVLRTNDAGETWSNQFVGDLSLQVDFFYTPIALWESFDNPNSRDSVMYYAKQNLTAGTTVQVRSNNSGQPFYYTLQEDLNNGDSVNVQDIVSSRFFIASYNKVYMTAELHQFDKTPEWFEISNYYSGFIGSAQCIGVSSDANHIFVGTRDGKLYRISNLALAYDYARADVNSAECIVSTQEIPLIDPSTSMAISQVVTSVSVDPQNPENVIITLGNYGNEQYVMYCENALDEVPEFNSRQGNLPQMPVYSSVIEMTNTDMAFIGTERGIFLTENIHESSPVWVAQDSLMYNVPVMQLQQQIVSKTADTVYLINGNETIVVPYDGTNNYGVIYAATYGRGLFRCNTYRKPVGIEEQTAESGVRVLNSVKVYPNPVTNYASISMESVDKTTAQMYVYDLNGRVIRTAEMNIHKGNNVINVDFADLSVGTYVIKIVAGSEMYSGKFIKN